MTAMNSKLISGQKVFFSKMVVDAVQTLDEDLDLDLIGIKKVTGGAMQVRPFLPIPSPFPPSLPSSRARKGRKNYPRFRRAL